MKYIVFKCASFQYKIGRRSLWVAMGILFFSFQRVFIKIHSAFGYVDELLAIYILLIMAFRICTNQFTKKELLFVVLMIMLTGIGLGGNIMFGVMKQAFPIAVDFLSIFKVFLAYYGIRMMHLSEEERDETVAFLASAVRSALFIMLICYILAYMGVFEWMFASKRYGIPSFRFLDGAAGNYSKWFYLAIPVLSADIKKQNTRREIIWIVIGLLLWVSTMRSRAIAFAVCYVFFALWYFNLRGKAAQGINLWNILPIGILALIIGWEKVVFYFTNDTQARANLLRYSVMTAQRFFPIGAGFGSYGSDVAIKYYSPLYTEYGFRKIYGMGYVHTKYLNDNYWPMILGQFGLIGVAIVVWILYNILKEILQRTVKHKVYYFANICAIFFLLVSSIASKSYSEFVSIAVFMFHGLFITEESSILKLKKSESIFGKVTNYK